MKEKIVYESKDGFTFDNKLRAIIRDASINYTRKLTDLPQISGKPLSIKSLQLENLFIWLYENKIQIQNVLREIDVINGDIKTEKTPKHELENWAEILLDCYYASKSCLWDYLFVNHSPFFNYWDHYCTEQEPEYDEKLIGSVTVTKEEPKITLTFYYNK